MKLDSRDLRARLEQRIREIHCRTGEVVDIDDITGALQGDGKTLLLTFHLSDGTRHVDWIEVDIPHVPIFDPPAVH